MPIGSSIIVCGQHFDVGQRVITWESDASVSAYTLHRTDKPNEIFPFAPAKGLGGIAARYRPRRLIGADRSLDRLKQVLRQFVIHHDGCPDSRTCFQVLHNERGLSVHFLIDNDGTIFQTLDLVDCAFQAAGVNEISIGVELANRGDAQRFPNEYRGTRDKVTCQVHGHQFLAYAYTRAQLESMQSLGKAMTRIFPNLPQTIPSGGDGEPIWTSLSDPRQYSGYLGHYHVTQQKWDPGPFDFKAFASKIRGRSFFPIVAPGAAKADMPDDQTQVEDQANQLYENNETDGEGGYYPVGPFGQSRLWHGGVHLRADKGTPVYAPFSGRIVGARFTDDCPIGSRNFVLMRHDLSVGATNVRFWSLFFHLDDESGASAPRWFQNVAQLFRDDPVPLAIDVSAGELIGRVGEAGPPGRLEGQVHFEIMSAEDLGEKIEPGFWHTIDGASMGRFCNAPEVIDKIDRPNKDGVLTRAEVVNFFRQNPQREEFHRLAIHHLTEWADENDWEVALNRSKDFAALPPAQRSRVFRDQIEPVLWWNDDIEHSAELPSDKMVWNYHPITFLVWIHDRLRNSKATAQGIGAAADFRGNAPPSNITDDATAMEGFTDDEDTLFGEAAKKLDLEDLAKGFPDDK